ncbi:hypothetical protein [Streptomyces tubercidicus]|uniref:hypothetical protein n=1 Tax=Streptomyces tubercidicus TaxID=47759 RepID=UPI0034669A4A
MRTPIRLQCTTDSHYGGRWTSLRGGGREWLWSRPEPRRLAARPGTTFADAGGIEECIPTIRGIPDHGDAWSRPWRRTPQGMTVECPDFTLTRCIHHWRRAVVAHYRLEADPGYRFLWAAHALLDLSETATIQAPAATPTRLFAEAAPHLGRLWPRGAVWIEGPWPAPSGYRLDHCGPADGTAVGAILRSPQPGRVGISVTDGIDTLRMRLEAQGQPTSVALWRNMAGFPPSAPYRSVGIEPMLGTVFDLADADDTENAIVPPAGVLRWRLTITAKQDHTRTKGT